MNRTLLLSLLLLAVLAPGCTRHAAYGRLGSSGALLAQLPPMDAMTLEWRYRIDTGPETRKVRFVLLLPRTLDGRQSVAGLAISREPTRRFTRGADDYAEYVIEEAGAGLRFTVTADVLLFRNDLETARKRGARVGRPPDLDQWLASEKHIERSDAAVLERAARLPTASGVEGVRAVWDAVLDHMEYAGFSADERGAAGALDDGEGDCTDYADLFVALCRARGIPARVAKGVVTDFGDDTSKHSWAEAWIDDLGWVTFDPLWGDLGKASFERMQPVYLTLSYVRNDPELDGYHDWAYWYWGGKATVKESLSVRRKLSAAGL
jgi:transglutaminase-like putative cysteine protease